MPIPPRIITVHGTWDADKSEYGDRWWQIGGPLHKKLKEQMVLGDHMLAPDILRPFLWDGENSEISRLAATERLATMIVQHSLMFDIHIVAHSHGGNIVRAALSNLRAPFWAGHLRSVKSVTTVGTPFYLYDPSRSARHYGVISGFGGIMFLLGIVGISLSALPPLLLPTAPVAATLLTIASLAAAAFLIPVGTFTTLQAVRSLHSIQKDRAAPELNCNWDCLHSKGDEAIIALSMVQNEIQFRSKKRPYFPLPINYRLLLGWTLAIAGGLAGAITIGFVPLLYLNGAPWQLELVPLVAAAIFAATTSWLIAKKNLPRAISTFLENSSAAVSVVLNRVIADYAQRQLAKAAYGDDCNAGICGVALKPWPNVGTLTVCGGDLHLSLEQQVAGSFSKTIGEIRENISTQNVQGIKMAGLKEWMSWNELVHTAYFRNDDFLDFLAARLKIHHDATSPSTSATSSAP